MVKSINKPRQSHQPAPKPVHPTSIRHHGLFGPGFVRKHMIIDRHWKNEDLIDEYFNMTLLLKKHLAYNHLKKKTTLDKLNRTYKKLRYHVQNGRKVLKKSLGEDFRKTLRSILIDHKKMQRLYGNMSPHEIEDNVKQRSFVMRKERDRLTCTLELLKNNFERVSIEFSQLEDRIAYQSEYALHEELAIRTLHREIKNSSTRLKAIKILNTTYKQLLATLKGDEKFLEPILNSLTKDIEDQQNFIAYVLYMGTPAMSKVMELRHTIAKMEDVNRKQRNTKNLWASEARRNSWQTKKYSKDTNVVINLGKHYARETRDMTLLRRVLNDVEGRVKKLQQGTLSWKPEAIPSVLKQQTTNNESLKKQISLNSMHMELLSHRNTNLYYQQQFRNMDFGGKFLKNKEHIQKLEQQILKEELKKNETIKWIHERAKVSVVISCSLWNFFDILRHVPVRREPKTKSLKYPKEYLKLPLLRFENMEMKVSPPLEFEGDVLTVLRIVNQKLKKLMGAYDQLISEKSKKDSESSDVVVETTEEYCALYLQSAKSEDFTADLMSSKSADQSNDPSPKDNVKIPSRGFLKDLSIKIVEKNLTKEE